MTTPYANDQLTAYLDGELDPTEIADLERALEADPTLRAELDELEQVVHLLKAHGPAPAPSDFHANVMAAIEAEHPTPSFWDWLRRPFGVPLEGLAIAAAVAVVLWFVLPGQVVPPEVEPGEAASPAAAVPTKGLSDGAADDGVAAAELPSSTPDGEGTEAPAQGKSPSDADKAAPVPDRPAKAVAEQKVQAPADEPAPVPLPAEPTEVAGTDEPASEMVGAGYSYTVYADSADALADLFRVAGKHGGTVHDAQDQPLRDAVLSQSDTLVYVHIPAVALPRFSRDLESVMMRVDRQGTSELTSGSNARVSVTLKLVGGAVEPAVDKKNATKRKAMEADAYEVLESF